MDLQKRKQELEQRLQNVRGQYQQAHNSIENIKGAIAIIDEQLKEEENVSKSKKEEKNGQSED